MNDFLNSLNQEMTLVGGLLNLGQALAHRLETPRGGLFYDGDYGTDLRAYCNDTMTQASASRCSADAQAVYKTLDPVMLAVLTNPNANISQLLATATSQVNQILANSG